MNELKEILKTNKIEYQNSIYGHKDRSIIIKKNNYKIEIYEDKESLVSDLQKVPYTWGKMSKTTVEQIIQDLKKYLKIEIKNSQISIFDYIGGEKDGD